MNFLIECLKWAVLFTGILDAFKYKFLAQKVARLKSSREVSRKLLNISILYRVLLLIYSSAILKDWVLIIGCIVAIYTAIEAFYYTYWYYPYKRRGLRNFKRPPLWKYIWNSIVPNHWAKRL